MTASEPTSAPPPGVRRRSGQSRLPSWRWEALRTTFWLVPTLLIVVAGLLFLLTFEIDWAVYHKHLALPFWIVSVSATAGREVLIGIAAAIITVVGVVFSVTIVALTLASQQFGPRMMRNFVRDVGNQVTLGVFVATFVYSILTLVVITADSPGGFVPHLSITVSEALMLVDIARADLLHPPHLEVHPAARGHRQHRQGPRRARSTPSSPRWRRTNGPCRTRAGNH